MVLGPLDYVVIGAAVVALLILGARLRKDNNDDL